MGGCDLTTSRLLIQRRMWGQLQFLKWLAHSLVIPRRIGSFQLCVLGPAESQKTLLAQMLSSFLKVYYVPPTLDCFAGAESGGDIWVIDGCSSSIFSQAWARSASAVKLAQLLDGQRVTLSWGPNKSFAYHKDRNVPILLIGEDEVPMGFFHPRFQSRIVYTFWWGHARCMLTLV